MSTDVTRWTGNNARPLLLDEDDVVPGEPVRQDVLANGLTVAGSRAWLSKRASGAEANA